MQTWKKWSGETEDTSFAQIPKHFTFSFEMSSSERSHPAATCRYCNVQLFMTDLFRNYATPDMEQLQQHLKDHTDLFSCEFCGATVRSEAGMAAHQKSRKCVGEQRRAAMKKRGYGHFNNTVLNRIMHRLLTNFCGMLAWDDTDSIETARQAREDSSRWIYKQLDAVYARTKIAVGTEGEDNNNLAWAAELWVPWDVAHFVSLLDKNYIREEFNLHVPDQDLRYLSLLCDFASGDQEKRDAMIGGLELMSRDQS